MTGREPTGWSRREFMTACAGCSAAFAAGMGHWTFADHQLSHSAMHWEPLPDGTVQCRICPNMCICGEGQLSDCKTRINRAGRMVSLSYGLPCVLFADTLEKNPLYHVAPGSRTITLGTAGCNLRCAYCQNWEFSQADPRKTKNMKLSPADVVRYAKDRSIQWITFTYTEPVAYYEYAVDIAARAKAEGLSIAVVTAGYINPKPLQQLLDVSDAFCITLKGYDEDFYQDVIGCSLNDVWRAIKQVAKSGVWLEIVNLIVPTLNDDMKGIGRLARALASVDQNIPLHFLRFVPDYKLQHLPPTPTEIMEKAKAEADEQGMRYVYLDNLPGHPGSNTLCHQCGAPLIERSGFNIMSNRIKNSRCPDCGVQIPGRWSLAWRKAV